MNIARRLAALVGTLAVVAVTLVPALTVPQSASATANCAPVTTELDNGSFEAPVIPNSSYRQVNESTVPGWSTTATDHLIELWSSGFNGVQAASGRQFAELNATQSSALYQDLPTTPGQTLTWSLAHRARQGTDTMRVLIGTPGNMVQVAVLSDTTAAWGRHTGSYTVPAGQTSTRFAFESVSTGSGNPTIGNFLDDVSFGTPACVTATKQVLPAGTANVGDRLTYIVQLTNDGGAATSALSLTDVVPTGTSYVAGSASPAATVAGSTLTFSPAGASGTAGVLEPGGTTTVTFQVEVLTAAANSTVSNSANVTYNDGLVANSFATNTVTTPVNAAADVKIEKFYPGYVTAIAAGGIATLTLAATNLGPNTATGVVISDQLPAGLTVTTSLPTGCSAVGQLVTCTAGTLANGTSQSFSFDVTAPNTAQVLYNTARVVSSSFDPNPANDEVTAPLSVAPPTPANVQIFKTGSPDVARAGDQAAFQLTIFNSGQSSTSTAYTLTDPIPAGFSVSAVTVDQLASSVSCSTSGQTLSCTVASGFYGAISTASWNLVRVTVQGRIDATVANGTVLHNVASINTPTPQTASADITVNAAADVFVTKTLSTAPQPGVPVGYVVTVINAGPSTAAATVLTDTLPTGTTLLTTPSQCSLSGLVLSCALGDMAPGSVQVLNYEVAVPNAGGTFVNSAVATSNTPIIDPSGATDSVTFSVAAFGRLAETGASLAGLWLGIALVVLGGIVLVLYLVRRRKNN